MEKIKITQEIRMKQIFFEMDNENRKCADCGKESPEYASINNGIIICSNCAETHKSLGTNISFLREIEDKWDDYLLRFIKSGGNSRFKQFCLSYHINEMDINNKYKTKASIYYREIIKSEVMGYDPPNNIELQFASQIVYDIPNNYPEFNNYSSIKQIDLATLEKKYIKKKETPKNIMGSISGFFNSLSKKVNDTADNFVYKINELKDKNIIIDNGLRAFNKVENVLDQENIQINRKNGNENENINNNNGNINFNNTNNIKNSSKISDWLLFCKGTGNNTKNEKITENETKINPVKKEENTINDGIIENKYEKNIEINNDNKILKENENNYCNNNTDKDNGDDIAKLDENENNPGIYMDSEEIDKIIKEATQAQIQNKFNEKIEIKNDLNNEIIKEEEKNNNEENKKNENPSQNEQKKDFDLEDDDELLKKIAEIENSD